MSLIDQIKEAQSADELATLLKLGETYEFASAGTRRKWQRIAAKRAGFLLKRPISSDAPVAETTATDAPAVNGPTKTE